MGLDFKMDYKKLLNELTKENRILGEKIGIKHNTHDVRGFRYMKKLKAFRSRGMYYYRDDPQWNVLKIVAKLKGKVGEDFR